MTLTPADIAVALGRTTPDSDSPEHAQWEMWIADAYMLIEAHLGDLDDLDEAKLTYVVREAVVAHIQRPDDATQVAVSVDDGNVSRTYRSSAGRVRILDEWWDLLSPATANGAFSIFPQPAALMHAPWCGLTATGSVCSCANPLSGEPWVSYGPGVAW